MATYLILIVMLAPWLGALLIWLLGDGRPRAQHVTACVFSLAAAAAAVLLLLPANWSATGQPVLSIPFGDFIGEATFVADGLGGLLAAIAAGVGSLTVIFSVDYMRGEAQLGRYYALVLLFIGSMCGLVLSGNLLFLFLFWEMTAFCSYALIAFHNDDPKAVAAGIKALLVTQAGGLGLLVGVLLAGAYLPDLQVATLLSEAGQLPQTALAVLAFGFLLAAIAKSAQVPLHIWLPDAMEAPTPVSALIHAATMVNAGVYLLARFYPALSTVTGWATIVLMLGLASVLVGGLMAAVSNDLKRVLAYSTISQLGYMVAGIGAGALLAGQFFLLSHALFKALLFLGAGAIIHALGTRNMQEMGGMWKRMPFTSVCFLIGAAALVGLPPLNGFWSKELLLETTLEEGATAAYLLMALGAGLTAFYVARMCRLVFFRRPESGTDTVHATPTFMRLAMAPLAFGVFTSWLLLGRFFEHMTTTMTYHVEALANGEIALHLISPEALFSLSTALVLTLTLIGLGLGYWLTGRSGDRIGHGSAARSLQSVEKGFNSPAYGLAGLTNQLGAVLQKTQTGQLNWNLAGIVLALAALLLLVIGSM